MILYLKLKLKLKLKPKFLKNCPEIPGMAPTGKNTATIQKLVATTGRPISSAASIEAC